MRLSSQQHRGLRMNQTNAQDGDSHYNEAATLLTPLSGIVSLGKRGEFEQFGPYGGDWANRAVVLRDGCQLTATPVFLPLDFSSLLLLVDLRPSFKGFMVRRLQALQCNKQNFGFPSGFRTNLRLRGKLFQDTDL